MKSADESDNQWCVDDSVHMNSHRLYDVFSEVYRDFFYTHDMVLSAPSILTWWADISHGVSILRLKQKLPLKTYCWVRFNSSWRITFRSIYVYSILEDTFNEVWFDSIFSTRTCIEKFLEEILREQCWVSSGIEIDIIAEAPPWHGFAFSSWVSVLLAYIISIISQKVDISLADTDREIALEKALFEEVYILSQQIWVYLSVTGTIGSASNRTIMQRNNPHPTVHFWERWDAKKHKTLYHDTIRKFIGIDQWDHMALPLDYGVIFTGLTYRFKNIISTRKQDTKKEVGLDIFLKKRLKELGLIDEASCIWGLLNSEEYIFQRRNIENMNLKILEWFSLLLTESEEDVSVQDFIERIQKVGLESFSYQKVNSFFFALQYHFDQLKQFQEEHIGILPFNTGKVWGSLLFVLAKDKSQQTLTKALRELRKEWHIASLVYASWRDGVSHDGVHLEQYISQKIYSQYIRAGDVIFRDSHGTSYCGNYESILEREQDAVILDSLSSRIYIRGTKLTSRDIHSQNTTIDVLRILIENIGQEVSNSWLPISTYSQNKTELLTKIIRPIKWIIQQHYNRELSLTCSGGISEYLLRLERDDAIRIGIIEMI